MQGAKDIEQQTQAPSKLSAVVNKQLCYEACCQVNHRRFDVG